MTPSPNYPTLKVSGLPSLPSATPPQLQNSWLKTGYVPEPLVALATRDDEDLTDGWEFSVPVDPDDVDAILDLEKTELLTLMAAHMSDDLIMRMGAELGFGSEPALIRATLIRAWSTANQSNQSDSGRTSSLWDIWNSQNGH